MASGPSQGELKFALLRSLVSQAVILALLIAFWRPGVEPAHAPATAIPYAELLKEIEAQNLKEVTIEGRKITAVKSDGSVVETTGAMPDHALLGDLTDNGIKFDVRHPQAPPSLSQTWTAWFPALLAAGLWVCFIQRLYVKGGIFSKGKINARPDAGRNGTIRRQLRRGRHRRSPPRSNAVARHSGQQGCNVRCGSPGMKHRWPRLR